MEVRLSNVAAAKSVAQVLRSSLGPRGLDKMIKTADGKVLITNDGATILKHMALIHPCAKMLVELSAAQDSEAGDGTTSVVVVAGALLGAVERLLQQGLHPSLISEAFLQAVSEAHRILEQMSTPVNLSDREALIRAAMTSLGSKVVAPYAQHVAGIAVDAVLQVATGNQADLDDVRVVTRLGGTIDEMKLVEGVLLKQTLSKSAPDAPQRMEKARIGLVQFQLSAPKTDMESAVVVTDYQQMDRLLAEERAYLLNLCKRIKKAGCNVLLVQKSILREGVSELAHHYLAKLKIMVVPDIERDEIEFLSRSLGCKPIADAELFTEDRLGSADLVEEVSSSYIHISGIKAPKTTVHRKTCSILVRGGSAAVLAEAERSLHDALCVIRCLVRQPAMIVGGGAPEAEMAFQLGRLSRSMSSGAHARCVSAYAEALEAIPVALAENAGLDPILIGTELRARHAAGHPTDGINVRKACIGEMVDERVVQPLLVSKSVIQLATETVCQILKIDDIVQAR